MTSSVTATLRFVLLIVLIALASAVIASHERPLKTGAGLPAPAARTLPV
jgi:hypothetical protein